MPEPHQLDYERPRLQEPPGFPQAPLWASHAMVFGAILQISTIAFQWYDIMWFDTYFRPHLRMVTTGGWNARESELYYGVISIPFWSQFILVPAISVLAFWVRRRWWILVTVVLGLLVWVGAWYAFGRALEATV